MTELPVLLLHRVLIFLPSLRYTFCLHIKNPALIDVLIRTGLVKHKHIREYVYNTVKTLMMLCIQVNPQSEMRSGGYPR